ncbi:hypothetical protein BjapCC829_48655 (plasmid) [Bradyrhizobium barranii]|uniref:Uncharacterized protein n=1 Tax=Bradyrhizobium barranii TaxID=2992140 RepID=A0ABY3R1I2_9BRAD|nr:hypothetical protein [Bradyrhizobium japonicum]UFW92125.1 hypothetical protein BjapCC829_48655 [Bradyrhizobium japonicum]
MGYSSRLGDAHILIGEHQFLRRVTGEVPRLRRGFLHSLLDAMGDVDFQCRDGALVRLRWLLDDRAPLSNPALQERLRTLHERAMAIRCAAFDDSTILLQELPVTNGPRNGKWF